MLGLEQAGQRIGGRELRAVEQRQALLGAERQRREAGSRQAPRRPARVSPSTIDLADADHRRRHVGERREIARGADRALARHDRDQAASPASLPAWRCVSGRTPEAPCARLASLSAIISRTTGAGVGSPTPAACDSTMLRCSVARSAGVDAHAGELAEAGVDAVDGSPLATIAATARRAGARRRGCAGRIERDARRRDRSRASREAARRRASASTGRTSLASPDPRRAAD